jgi:hypothetical protein
MLLVISVMPLMAQTMHGPISAQVASASVVFGPGIIQDRSGETPAPKFEPKLSGEVHLEGLRSGTKPRFRYWLVKAGDEEKLQRASPGSLKAKILAANAGVKTDTGYVFQIRWVKGAVDPGDRLFVEVFLGRRRAATAIAAIQSHFLPASHSRGGESNN